MAAIHKLQIENVKRVRALSIDVNEIGLTTIGGGNRAGKTSVLDAIAWALGGDRFKPTNPKNDEALSPPQIRITLSNGIVVERCGKNATLKVTDPTGKRGGQKLLDDFVSALALDLPKFMGSKDKARILITALGIGDQLESIDSKCKSITDSRRDIGKEYKQKASYAAELEHHPDAPESPLSVSELLAEKKRIEEHNERCKDERKGLSMALDERNEAIVGLDNLALQITKLHEEVDIQKKMIAAYDLAIDDLEQKVAAHEEIPLDDITLKLESVDAVNQQVADNKRKAEAEKEAERLKAEYDACTRSLEDIEKQRLALLEAHPLPLPGLTVEDGELMYNGQRWDCMSGSEQLRVSAAIVKGINPECQFILVDKLEQMDLDTLRAFDAWLKENNLQAISTRVSTGDECSIIIENGLVKSKGDENGKP